MTKWIQKALAKSKKGSLHKELGIAIDKKIPTKKLKSAEKKGGKIAKQAHLAETLRSFHGGK